MIWETQKGSFGLNYVIHFIIKRLSFINILNVTTQTGYGESRNGSQPGVRTALLGWKMMAFLWIVLPPLGL